MKIKPFGSYLLVGGRKSIKKEIERIFSYLKIHSSNNPDLLYFNEEGLGIDTIRKIKKFLTFKSGLSKLRAIVIERGEGLTLDGQNAFLKTLEETKTNQLILVGAPQKDYLLPTIVSRCQIKLVSQDHSFDDDQELEKIVQAPLTKRFQLIKKAKLDKMSKSEMLEWAKKLVYQGHKKMISQSEIDASSWKKVIEQLNMGQKFLQANVSPATTVDWLMINL